VSVVGVKATTVAIAYEFHPLDLGVSCSILYDPIWYSGRNFRPVCQICRRVWFVVWRCGQSYRRSIIKDDGAHSCSLFTNVVV
jgi:hypothetical protein